MKLQLLIKIFFLQIILSKTLNSFGQDTIKIARRSFVESGVLVASASQTPFWLRANVLGVVPNTGTNFTLRGGFYQEYATKNSKIKKYNWGYGLNSVANINQGVVDFILPEAYIKAKAGIFEIWAGRRQEVMGLSDSSGIGTGPITLSGNAIPMPKVQFLTPNWVNLGFKGLFAAKVSYSHGWFDNGLVENSYLHQKSFYGRIGRPKAKFKFYSGITHNAQWGGKHTLSNGTNNGLNDTYYIYHDLPAYVAVVIPIKDRFWLNDTDINRYGWVDNYYNFGNHSGSFDLGFEITGKKRTAFVYKQAPFEYLSTNSGVTQFEDGLYGVKITNFKNEKVKEFVIEMLYTLNQSRYVSGFFKLTGLLPERWQGDDDYFNNGQYADGFVYKGKAISTPFIFPYKDYRGRQSSDEFQSALMSNILAFHVGMKGTISPRKIQYQLKASYSNNYIKNLNTPSRQFSLGVKTLTPIKLFGGSQLVSDLGFDYGDVYENVLGMSFGVRKSW